MSFVATFLYFSIWKGSFSLFLLAWRSVWAWTHTPTCLCVYNLHTYIMGSCELLSFAFQIQLNSLDRIKDRNQENWLIWMFLIVCVFKKISNYSIACRQAAPCFLSLICSIFLWNLCKWLKENCTITGPKIDSHETCSFVYLYAFVFG